MAKVRTTEGDRFGFYCPGCQAMHVVNDTWSFSGGYDRPTFRPSILVNPNRCNPTVPLCHSYVTDGRIQYLQDSTHELAGQTVDLPEVG